MSNQETNVAGNNIEIGSGNTIHGAVVAADSINDSFNVIQSSPVSDELKEQLMALESLIGQLLPQLPESDVKEVKELHAQLQTEALKEEPNKRLFKVSAEGLIDAGTKVLGLAAALPPAIKAIGQYVGVPIP